MEQLDHIVRRLLAETRRTMEFRADPLAQMPGDPPPEGPADAREARPQARSADFREELEACGRS